jgi:serine/threonine protein kinase
MNLVGQQLGEFTILERIGQGGMGAVYKARQTSLRRLVALKTLQASLTEDAEYIGRFQQEAVAAAGLNHPNLVQVHSAGETDGLHWFAIEPKALPISAQGCEARATLGNVPKNPVATPTGVASLRGKALRGVTPPAAVKPGHYGSLDSLARICSSISAGYAR